jgi:hypothetical protein
MGEGGGETSNENLTQTGEGRREAKVGELESSMGMEG